MKHFFICILSVFLLWPTYKAMAVSNISPDTPPVEEHEEIELAVSDPEIPKCSSDGSAVNCRTAQITVLSNNLCKTSIPPKNLADCLNVNSACTLSKAGTGCVFNESNFSCKVKQYTMNVKYKCAESDSDEVDSDSVSVYDFQIEEKGSCSAAAYGFSMETITSTTVKNVKTLCPCYTETTNSWIRLSSEALLNHNAFATGGDTLTGSKDHCGTVTIVPKINTAEPCSNVCYNDKGVCKQCPINYPNAAKGDEIPRNNKGGIDTCYIKHCENPLQNEQVIFHCTGTAMECPQVNYYSPNSNKEHNCTCVTGAENLKDSENKPYDDCICSAGYYYSSDNKSCKACDKGYYCEGGGGTQSNINYGTKTACPVGKTSDTGADAAKAATDCKYKGGKSGGNVFCLKGKEACLYLPDSAIFYDF